MLSGIKIPMIGNCIFKLSLMSPHDRNIVIFPDSIIPNRGFCETFFAFYAQQIMYNRSERNFVVKFLCVTFCYRYQCSLKKSEKGE